PAGRERRGRAVDVGVPGDRGLDRAHQRALRSHGARRGPLECPRRPAARGRRQAPGAVAGALEPRGRVRRPRHRRRSGAAGAAEGDRVVRAFVASVQEVFREAAARWTLIAYFALSTLFILLFAAAVNLDIVNGALAGMKLFGQTVDLPDRQIRIDELVLGFESTFSGVLYFVGLFLALFATAHLVPRLQEKGTIDLYLSRPIGRVSLLLSRYTGGLLLAAANLVYLIGTMWLLIVWKTRVLHPRFLLSGAVILFTIAV